MKERNFSEKVEYVLSFRSMHSYVPIEDQIFYDSMINKPLIHLCTDYTVVCYIH